MWKFLQTLFQEFYQKSQMWASTNYPMAEPRILDDFPSAVTLRERQVRGTEFPRIRSGVEGRTCSVDRQRKCSTAAFTGRDAAILNAFKSKGGKGPKGGGRNRDPKGGKDGKGKGGKADAHAQRLAKATQAKGNGQLKIQGGAGWPTWVPRVCWNYKARTDCHYGDQCNSYCYLTKDKDKYKKP